MKIDFLTKINYKENYPLMALITKMKNLNISVIRVISGQFHLLEPRAGLTSAIVIPAKSLPSRKRGREPFDTAPGYPDTDFSSIFAASYEEH